MAESLPERRLPKEVELGTAEAFVTDKEYEAVFRGRGYVTADHDEGSFLSNISYDQYGDLKMAYYDAAASGSDQIELPFRKCLGIEELFPKNWREHPIEYEIVIRARRIDEETL